MLELSLTAGPDPLDVAEGRFDRVGVSMSPLLSRIVALFGIAGPTTIAAFSLPVLGSRSDLPEIAVR